MMIKQSSSNLVGKIMILFLLLWLQCIPPLSEDLADRPVVLVRVSLVHKRAVSLAEYHERVHWSTHVVAQAVLRLQVNNK